MAGRVFERKQRQMPCTLTLGGRNHGGLILDVSPGGLFIQSSTKIKPGDQIEVQTTLPGVDGRVRMQVEVVRKVIVPSHLIKVARGGVGVRILNAPEGYYQFMEALGITSDSGPGPVSGTAKPGARSSATPAVAKAEPEPEPQASEEPAPPQPRFKVRIKQSRGPRSRAVEVAADSEDDALGRALAEVGDGWLVLGVDALDAD